MILARREFLQLLGIGTGAAGLSACDNDWSTLDRLIEKARLGPGEESFRHTICGLCEGGCGVTVRLVDGLPVGLKGNPRHPLSRGGLCPVGQAGLELLYAPERLAGPLRRGAAGDFQRVTWEEALGEIAARLSGLREQQRGHRIALLTNEPGQLFHELADRFMASLGSASLARVPARPVLPFFLSQGIEQVPGFDLGGADLVLSFGLDLFEDGPSPLYAISAMVGVRPDFERAASIHIGTRISPSSSRAEEYVPIESGSFAAMALGIAHVLVREGNVDRDFIAEHTFGFEDWTDDQGRRHQGFGRYVLENFYPARVGKLCGCEPERVVRIARRLARAARPIAIAGGEATAGPNVTWNGLAVHALNALLGAFDRPGGVVLPPSIPLLPMPSMTEPEQPSCFAAGGDPAAGLFGVDPIEALTARVLGGGDAEPIDALFVIGTNPVHASPHGERLLPVLERIPTVVALTPFLDETAAAADFVLPTDFYLETWRDTTTPDGIPISFLGLGQPVIEPLLDTRHPGDILLDLSRRTGGAPAAAMPWRRYTGYLKHRLRGLVVSGQGSVISGSFAESWVHFLEERGWRFLEHSDLETFWQDLARESGWWNPVRPRGDWGRMFRTQSGRYEFFSLILERRLREIGAGDGGTGRDDDALERGAAALGLTARGDEICLPHYEPPMPEGEGDLWLVPFRPITGRGELGVRSPMILEMFGYTNFSGWETWVGLAPATAHDLHVGDGDTVAVESARGTIEAVVRVEPGSVPGIAHMPVGLGHGPTGGAAAGVGSNPLAIVLGGRDPLAGTPSLTSTRVRLRLVQRRRHGGPPPLHGGHG